MKSKPKGGKKPAAKSSKKRPKSPGGKAREPRKVDDIPKEVLDLIDYILDPALKDAKKTGHSNVQIYYHWTEDRFTFSVKT